MTCTSAKQKKHPRSGSDYPQYQSILEKCWPQEPPGYRSAEKYINSSYVEGAAQLLSMLLASASPDPASIMLIAKQVMPNGNSAFLTKPDIPTFLVGSRQDLSEFTALVPAPNETYTSLFWVGDTSKVDAYFIDKKRQEQEAKKLSRATRKT